jgi:hypothetical protein
MKKEEVSLEIVGRGRSGINVNKEKLELDKGDTVKWKRKDAQAQFSFKIIFPEHSPFGKSEFMMGEKGETEELTVIYAPETCGWRRFKYVILAYDKPNLHFLDPELIIPKNARA